MKLVDAEDIATDKFDHMILPLKYIKLKKQLQTKTLDSSQQEQLMFTQPRDPNNRNKPTYKKYCSQCHRTKQSISACFKNQRDDEDKNSLC